MVLEPLVVEAEFSCEVTGFADLESEILRLRNANRERHETLEYLEWRYRSTADAPEPIVFWLRRAGGERIGMASVIFRPYVINQLRVMTAVVGDISLDLRWRRRGLGRRLLQYMTEHLDTHYPQQPAFVIPTEAARRVLTSLGWVTRGRLVPYVYVLDAERYLRTLLPGESLARHVAGWLATAIRTVARWRAPLDGALFFNDARDSSTFDLACALPGHEGAGREVSPASLKWRYAEHPHARFACGRFYRGGELRGFVILEDDALSRSCSIYDLASKTTVDARDILALCILRGLSSGLSSLRMILDERHPLRACLRGLGFIARRTDSVFQVHSRTGVAESSEWFVTQGDKDT